MRILLAVAIAVLLWLPAGPLSAAEPDAGGLPAVVEPGADAEPLAWAGVPAVDARVLIHPAPVLQPAADAIVRRPALHAPARAPPN